FSLSSPLTDPTPGPITAWQFTRFLFLHHNKRLLSKARQTAADNTTSRLLLPRPGAGAVERWAQTSAPCLSVNPGSDSCPMGPWCHAMSSGVDAGCERCRCHGSERQPAILYTLLSQELRPRQQCPCRQRRAVCLRTPQLTCRAASHVLLKTISFVKNVAAFRLLPREDQLLLLDGCWVPLFLLGLVQEMVTFEVTEAPAPSMLKKILLSGQSKGQEPEGAQPTLAAVQRLQGCLNSFWRLDLSPSEGGNGRSPSLLAIPDLSLSVLSPADIPGLRAALYIESLQREAQRALRELPHPAHRQRVPHTLRLAASLGSVPAALVTALFFRPIIGDAAMGELLAEMLFEVSGWPRVPWLPLAR
ncbi:hypothetical protein EK904_003329, partial [Melospiza melodia maxima]